MFLKDKNILVVGMARSGVHTVRTLSKLGARITINDIKTEEQFDSILKEIGGLCDDYILGKHPQDLQKYDLIVLSPGVPTDLDFIKIAKSKNIPLMGELELAYRLSKGKYIAITGTNGKTTTTALTGEIFQNAKEETYVVGNIGLAAISKALETTDKSVLITEVSSFQLETTINFRPKISVVLNLTPDHLNRHKTMERYIDAKANIFINQREDDILILNYDNKLTRELAKKANCQIVYFSRNKELGEGVFIYQDFIVIKENNNLIKVCNIYDIYIPGKHNLENALAATAIAYNYGINTDIIRESLKTFKGVEHRIEFVKEINGVKFYNDSKGTNPDAAIKAVEAIEKPIILIAGGMDKGSSFDTFIKSFNNKVKKLILLGETSDKIAKTAKSFGFVDIKIVKDMEEAVITAFDNSKNGDNILLSPSCASWDMYENFEHRGRHFKDCVHKLRRS